MAVQSYSENESEIRKNVDCKNNGDSILVGRTVFTCLACTVFYSYLPLQYQMPFVCPVSCLLPDEIF